MYRFSRHPRLAELSVAALIWTALNACTLAQGRLTAQYDIVMTGVTIGHVTFAAEIGATGYTTAASGKASGVLSMLVNGEGSVTGRGSVANGGLSPTGYVSKITDDEGVTELRLTFEDDIATEHVAPSATAATDRIPIAEADRRGVADPLSAVLLGVKPGGNFLATANCDHVLAIFDGRRRYDLALSYKRTDKVELDDSYAGAVLVCGVVLKPIAGYRPGSAVVKYIANRRDMELWFAPIAGTAFMAPIRVAMPTLIGTLKIQAEKFDAVAVEAPPPPAVPAPVTPAPLPPPQDSPQ